LSEPGLVGQRSLAGRSVALSVSDSADLGRLGLLPEHCRVAVAEVAQAVFLAGGQIVYGGNLDPTGFTGVLLDQALNFADARGALLLVVPHSVHRDVDADELRVVQHRLGVTGRLVLLNPDGRPTPLALRDRGPGNPAASLTAMRQHVTATTDARVIVGGKIRGHQGRLPGVIEEALTSLRAGHPLFAAGGFGGAACAVARWIGATDREFWPEGLPEGMTDAALDDASREISVLAADLAPTGLDAEQTALLAATHRAGDIASLVTLGAARALGPA